MTASLYIPRLSGLHSLNPLTKLSLALAAVVAGSTLETLPGILGVFALVLAPLAFWGRVLGSFLRTCAKVIWPFALSLFLIQGFFTPGETVLFAIGPFALKAEGLWSAAHFTARLLVALGGATLLTLTTRPDLLMHTLASRGLPSQLAYVVVAALQIIPAFQARAQAILDAQRSRGLETEGRLIRRLRALLPLVAPLILGSLMDLEERAIALEARAFTRRGPKTSLLEIPDSAFERIARWALLALAVLLIVARLV
jgi:energy-coupling factor transport system permease protein